MKLGMLWFDDDPRKPLGQKVAEAVAYYRRKYGEPNVCYVAPKDLAAVENLEVGVLVRPLATVPPHHLWVGQEERPRASVMAKEESVGAM